MPEILWDIIKTWQQIGYYEWYSKIKGDVKNERMIMLSTEVGSKPNLVCRVTISLLDILIC